MSVGVFTEKKHQPTEAEIFEAIGSRLPLWQGFIRFLRETYPSQEDFRFLYGKNYGWGLRFRIKGQLLTSLYPRQEGFAAQVNLGPEAVEHALRMDLCSRTRQVIEGAHAYPEGRWLFIPVESAEDLADVQKLLALRAQTKRLR